MMILLLFLNIIYESIAACSCDGDHYCYLNNCYSCSYFRKNWEAQIKDFETIIGYGNGIPAYSNINDTQHTNLSHFLTPEETGFDEIVYVGQKYQCVHYARHYWIKKFGAAFGDVDTADQIYKQTVAIDYLNGGERKITKFANGGKEPPQEGDLLIWNISQPYFPFGHVAVVLDVHLNDDIPYITLGEQNYDDIWDSTKYARKLEVVNFLGLTFINNKREVHGLEPTEKCKDYNGSDDDQIIGWVRLV